MIHTSRQASTLSNRRRTPRSEQLLDPPPWTDLIPEDQWKNAMEAIEIARKKNIPFMVGGGFALAAYTGRWRNTKDMDLYILPEHREEMMSALTEGGFADYYSQRAYDRNWIYRTWKADTIIDSIWAFANQRTSVTPDWFAGAPRFQVRGEELLVIPPEELLWSKLYVLQGDHSDWPDILNLLYAVGPVMDWDHVRTVVGPDLPLLQAVFHVLAWISPSRAREVVGQTNGWLKIPEGVAADSNLTPEQEQERVRLLDSRRWFAGFQTPTETLEI